MAKTARCVPSCSRQVPVKTGGNAVRWIGIGLIVVGLLMVFLCVPFWLWAVLIGVTLILLGFFLVLVN